MRNYRALSVWIDIRLSRRRMGRTSDSSASGASSVRDRPRRDGGPGASGLSPSLLSPSLRWPGHGVALRPSSISRHRGSSMLLERQVFQAKYGRGDELVALFQELNAQMGEGDETTPRFRLFTDATGPFFIVVTEVAV